jgi:hypothetical protein
MTVDDVETDFEESADAPRPSENWLAEQIWLITLEEGADS